MRSAPAPAAPRRRRRTVLAATGLVAALALTATACGGSEEDEADAKPSGGTSQAAEAGDTGDGKVQLPADLADRLKEHGIDVDRWKDGGWKDWDKDKWLSEAKDFVNPMIEGLWKPDRMQSAKEADKTVTTKDTAADQGVSDPEPAPVEAVAEKTPYHDNAAPVGKVFFDSPEGSMVCSGTVIKDANHPGKSNLVWTAGHCVHAGGSGGWYRNIAFVPSYNDLDKSEAELAGATTTEMAPYGTWWADWASTSNQWIQGGSEEGGDGAAYDYSVLHVQHGAGQQVPGGDGRRGTGGGLLRPFGDRDRQYGCLGLPGRPAVQRPEDVQVRRPSRPAVAEPVAADDVPHRVHHDRRFLRRRLVPGGGRRDQAGLEHVDRPPRQHLAGGPAARPGGRGDVPEHEPDVRRAVTRT
jgi:V8-like Glu-specific endopeptidase